MSGFEAVGLALSIWPLVVNALEAYQLAVSGEGWDILYLQFRTDKVIYVECVSSLLQGSVSERDLAQLCSRDRPNQPLWKEKVSDPTVRNSLERRLGPNRTPLVLEMLQGIDDHLDTVYRKIDATEEFLKETSRSKIRKLGRHIRINLPQSSIKEALRKVHYYNEELQRVLKCRPDSASLAQGRETEQATIPPENPAHRLRKFTTQANDIHDAIGEGYKCQCRNPHEANLRPPDDFDLSQPFDLLFPVDEAIAKGITGQDFPSPNSKSSGEKSDEEYDFSSISSRRWSSSKESFGTFGTLPSPATSPGSPIPFRGRSVSFSQSLGLEDGGLINDLCQFIRKLGESSPLAAPPSCLGVLGVKQKKYTVKVTSLDGDSTDLPSLVSLDDYLFPSHKSEATRKKRRDLALSLSIAILHFYTTPWIDMWWTWKDFCVLKGDKSQIFVTKKFYSVRNQPNGNKTRTNDSESKSAFWELIGEPILTRLGFALVELALEKRLSDFRRKDQLGGGDDDMVDMVDLTTAKRLVEEGRVYQEAGYCYNEAVKVCLEHQVLSGTKVTRLNSVDPKKRMSFQVDVEKYVVAPIKETLQPWDMMRREMEVGA